MKVLIAHDGSDAADAALDDLSYAGLPDNLEGLVLSAGEITSRLPRVAALSARSGYIFPDDPDVEAVEAEVCERARKLASLAADRLRAQFPKWRIDTDAVEGMADLAIVKKASEWGADLIVMGSHGRRGWRRFLLGSVSEYVLNHTHCSVRIGRRPPHPHDRPVLNLSKGPIRLLVGTDGLPDADAAVQSIAARHWPKGTEARVVGVVDRPSLLLAPAAGVAMSAVEEEFRNTLAGATSRAARDLNASGVSAVAQVLHGNPAHVLLARADEWSADCIFVGATGLNAFERAVLGSVSSTVACRAHCSVEVIRLHR